MPADATPVSSINSVDQRQSSSPLWLAVYAVVAALFTWAYWIRSGYAPHASPEELTAFTATTPFQYRVLVPAFVHGIEVLAHNRIPLNRIYLPLTWVSAIVLVLVFRSYLRLFTSSRAAAPAALAIFWPLLFNYSLLPIQFFYPYDLPAIIFFMLGMITMLRRQWAWYYLIFVLATFNRETSCFLAVAMLFLFWNKYPKGG